MSPRNRKPIMWLSLLLGLILLVGGGILSAGGQFDPQQAAGGGDWLTALLVQMDQASRNAANPTEQALLDDKRSRLQQVQQARQEAGLLAAPTLTLGVCPPPEPTVLTADLPQGIFELEDGGDYEDLDFMALNGWRGEVNGNQVTVMAGWQLSDPAQGKLVLFTVRAPMQEVLAPAQGGGLRISAAAGYRLTLTDEQGEVYYFDVAARRWLTSPDEIVPTLPPLPTDTPAASLPCP